MRYLSRRQALVMLGTVPFAALAAARGQIVGGDHAGQLAPTASPNAASTPPTAASPTADADVAGVVVLSQQALQRAQTVAADAQLRQIDFEWSTPGRIFYRFTDSARTQEIYVEIPGAGASPSQWLTDTGGRSQLTGPSSLPTLDIRQLRVGPQAAAQAMLNWLLTNYPSSSVHALGLVPAGGGLTWYVSSRVQGGVVDGTVSNDTGAFSGDYGGRVLPVPTIVQAPATPSPGSPMPPPNGPSGPTAP